MNGIWGILELAFEEAVSGLLVVVAKGGHSR